MLRILTSSGFCGSKGVKPSSIHPCWPKLLNPSGLHGQGFKFLDGFFEIIRPILLRNMPSVGLLGLGGASGYSRPTDWEVELEKVAEDTGRFDIHLWCRSLDLLMVIENKVDAKEGEKQLRRYEHWLAQQEKRVSNCILIFLTVDGRQPDSIKQPGICICISYRHHIIRWLEKALPGLEAPRLRLALEQYLEVVRAL